MTLQGINAFRRNLLPYTLSLRLITLTTTPSMAAFVQIGTAHAEPNTTQITAERFSVSEFVEATNAARREAGLAELTVNTSLNAAAALKLDDMRANGYWDHYRPSDRKAPWDFMKESGYAYKVAGENLARGFSTVNGITKAWLESPSHRANLLSEKYTEVGFANAYLLNDEGKRVLVTVQLFGAR
jgi:uncharacterized protein YkwD